jgi:hypothetical protein
MFRFAAAVAVSAALGLSTASQPSHCFDYKSMYDLTRRMVFLPNFPERKTLQEVEPGTLLCLFNNSTMDKAKGLSGIPGPKAKVFIEF